MVSRSILSRSIVRIAPENEKNNRFGRRAARSVAFHPLGVRASVASKCAYCFRSRTAVRTGGASLGDQEVPLAGAHLHRFSGLGTNHREGVEGFGGGREPISGVRFHLWPRLPCCPFRIRESDGPTRRGNADRRGKEGNDHGQRTRRRDGLLRRTLGSVVRQIRMRGSPNLWQSHHQRGLGRRLAVLGTAPATRIAWTGHWANRPRNESRSMPQGSRYMHER